MLLFGGVQFWGFKVVSSFEKWAEQNRLCADLYLFIMCKNTSIVFFLRELKVVLKILVECFLWTALVNKTCLFCDNYFVRFQYLCCILHANLLVAIGCCLLFNLACGPKWDTESIKTAASILQNVVVWVRCVTIACEHLFIFWKQAKSCMHPRIIARI